MFYSNVFSFFFTSGLFSSPFIGQQATYSLGEHAKLVGCFVIVLGVRNWDLVH